MTIASAGSQELTGTLPRAPRVYVALVVAGGAATLVASVPRTFPDPGLFLFLLLAACLTSAWKINLPIPLASGSTLSVSYAADLMALLLLGPRAAVLVAVAGVWTQCTVNVKQRYPLYRTVFSLGAEAITMAATGVVYQALGGTSGPFDVASLMKPLVGAIATYFCLNTGLVALAIAVSTGRSAWRIWREEFLWSAASFMVAGSAGAIAAVVIQRGEHWKAVLLLAPVYLTYRTYQVFVGRLEDQKRHMADAQRLHRKTVEALVIAGQAERALATEKERLAAALTETQAARASAEAANCLKDQFLATVSHELRTPLNAILGWADMLCTGILPEPRRAAACEAIFNNAQRQARLIDELLDMARIMSGKLRLERALVEAQHVVNGALETVQPAAEAKGIAITVDVDPAVGTFYGDPARLQQVLWNLLSNAVKFTPEGGSVQVRVRRRGGAGEIVVADSGAGISRDFLPAVFEPFRQADGSTTRLYDGLGLGLAIVKQLVEAHGGWIKVDSAGEGRGATFTVRLPLARAVPHARQATQPSVVESESAVNSLAGLSVLVVDDDEDSRQVVSAYLEAHHATVQTVGSAADALDFLQREVVDVLLADVAMPGEDGYGLIRKLRAQHMSPTAMIPAAALTAFAREEDRVAALNAGFQMHLTKPIDAVSLVAAVAALGRSKSYAGVPAAGSY
jgi:signal transduction histidine kinase/ActR/RegA family two-component response regulator